MRVKYFYTWGYFHPVACGTDRVASNHFEYFRARGWSVDLILVNDERKHGCRERFLEQYSWLNSITEVALPPGCWFTFRDLLFGYEHLARSRVARAALARPADLFFTNYVFTAALLDHVPRDCRRVVETHDLMTRQFALAERESAGAHGAADPLARAREDFWLRTEMELYRLFDGVIMINADELKFVKSLGAAHARYVPQLYEATALAAPPAGHDFDLLFVGSEVPINVRGMTWFYHHVYVPYLWRHGVRLGIVGNVCKRLDIHDAHVTRLSRVDGPLDKVYASAKLAIVPIFEGTGLSIKTLEALAMGRPMVVAPAGARGLDDRAGAYVKIDMKADPKQTAQVILDLLADPARRAELQRAALAYVRREFSREAFFTALDAVIDSVGLGRDGGPAAVRAFGPSVAGRIGPLAHAG